VAIEYRVYSNGGSGGPVDYSTVLATTASLSITMPALATTTDTTFAVRAFDTISGLDDMNRDALARVIVDASGRDVTAVPNPVMGLSARPAGVGSILVEFAHMVGGLARPTGFHVWATVGIVVDYSASPALVIAYPAGSPPQGYRPLTGTVAGLAGGTGYAVGVRAYNTAGDDGTTDPVLVTPASAAPLAVGSPTISPSVTPSPTGRAFKGTGL
jgi:hypothetical protein